jgi:hypothetical protein
MSLLKLKMILAKLDRIPTFIEKLEYLNTKFLEAKTKKDETLILTIIEKLRRGY